MKNSVLDFMDEIHRFEQEKDLFQLEENGLLYWDIVRPHVLSRLFYAYYNPDEYYKTVTVQPPAQNGMKKAGKLIKWLFWLTVNELNFLLFLRKRQWLFLKISRFYDAKNNRSYDAVADEIHAALQNESNTVDTFKNAQTDITRIGHRYQTYHLYTYRNWYKKKHFRSGKTYSLDAILKERFPFASQEDWNTLIQNHLLEFEAEYRFGRRLFKKAKPAGVFFTGGAKGYVAAAKSLNIHTIEIQHSPLNKADLHYSYAPGIHYTSITTIPDFLLVNSGLWEERIFYPPRFIVTGSDYFYESSKPVAKSTVRNNILFVSDPLNHNLIRDYIQKFISRNTLTGYTVVFKLHSAETDRYEEAKAAFKDHPEVTVILNEKNISQLLDESCATFIIYSTVAYQAVQKGLQVYLLKTGYYEGGYDLFDLPNVQLIGLDENCTIEAIRNLQADGFEPLVFFEPFNVDALNTFVSGLQSTKN